MTSHFQYTFGVTIVRKIITVLILIGLVLLLATTNPTKSEYNNWLKQAVTNKIGGGPFASGLMTILGGPLINSATAENNYVLFTIFKTSVDSQDYITSIGIFHQFIPIQEDTNGINTVLSSTTMTPTTAQPTTTIQNKIFNAPAILKTYVKHK